MLLLLLILFFVILEAFIEGNVTKIVSSWLVFDCKDYCLKEIAEIKKARHTASFVVSQGNIVARGMGYKRQIIEHCQIIWF